MNKTHRSADAIGEMLEEVKRLNLKKLVIDYAVRFETPHDIFACNSAVLTKKATPKAIIECLRLTKEKGLTHSRRFTCDSPCLAIVPRQFIIDPVGDLYKCAAFAGEKDFVVGSIYDEDMNDRYVDMVALDAWQDCKECEYVPLCGGGCLFLNRNASGDYKKKECQKHLFGTLVMETLISSLDKDAISAELLRKAQEDESLWATPSKSAI